MAHRILLLLASILSLLGCSRGGVPGSSSAPAVQRSIVLVVDNATAANVADELRKGNISVTNDKSLLDSASLVVIAQDATTGPMPVHQEIVQQIARAGKHNVLWIQTKSTAVDDQELLELEELEARELLNKHTLPGDTIQFAVDAESAPVDPKVSTLKGWPAILRFVQAHNAE